MKSEDEEEESLLKKIFSIKGFTKTVKTVLKISINSRDINLCYFGSFVSSLNGTIHYLFIKFIISDYFGNSEDEIMQAKTITQLTLGISTAASIIVAFFGGWISDKIPLSWGLIIFFGIAAVFNVMIVCINDPTTWSSILISVCINNSGILSLVVLKSLFNKSLKKSSKGIVTGIDSFFASIGVLIGTKFGAYLYEDYGQKSPFYMAFAATISFVICLIIFKVIV